VREELARLWPSGIDRAKISLQKNTARLVAPQNSPFVGRFDGVIAKKLFSPHTKMSGEPVRIAFGDLRGSDAAAIRARRAIDGFFDTLGDRLQSPFNKVVALHPGAEAAVFCALLFAESLDLDKIRGEFFRQAAVTIIVGTIMKVMDQLSLSLWLPRGLKQSRARQFEKLLRTFPFSQRTQPQSLLSIHGVDSTEPSLLERPLNGPIDPAEIMEVFQEYSGGDIAYELESWWDLWHFNDEWALAPTRVALACFGTDFDNGTGRGKDQEDLRVDFGTETDFLPQPEIPGSVRLVESNIKSLLRLVHELDSALTLERRSLETESGENFAFRLQELLTSGAV
jgi:hypothetical protein